jgi:ankyrin repeat protein
MNWTTKYATPVVVIAAIALFVYLTAQLGRHDSALLRAVIEEDLPGVTQALDDGGNVNMSIRNGYTLLMVVAKRHGDVEMAKLLSDRGAPITAINDKGQSAVSLARSNGHEELVAFLVDAQENSEKPQLTPGLSEFGTDR